MLSKIKYREILIFLIVLILSACLAILLHFCGLNQKLDSYSDFISDIQDIVAIFTGFSATLIGIIAAIPYDSYLMRKITSIDKTKKEFYLILFGPFTIGIIDILLSLYFRLYLDNTKMLTFNFWGTINILFLFISLSFVFYSVYASTIAVRIIVAEKEIEEQQKTKKDEQQKTISAKYDFDKYN